MVTVVDGVKFLSELSSKDFLITRSSLGADINDDRTISELLVDQVETSNIILLNKIDLLSTKEIDRVQSLIRGLNSYAKIIPCSYGKISLDHVINTTSFHNMANTANINAAKGKEINDIVDHNDIIAKEKYNITSFSYKTSQAFHPSRLAKCLTDFCSKFNIIRSKGFIWIAPYADYRVYWTHAGSTPIQLILRTTAKKNKRINGNLQTEKEQEVVLIGFSLDSEAIEKALDECLLQPFENKHEVMKTLIGKYNLLVMTAEEAAKKKGNGNSKIIKGNI